MNDELVRSKDGTRIAVRAWSAGGPAHAAIVLVHGYKAHGGSFLWAAAELARRGFAVFALDLRGHGRSEGDRLWVDRFADYVDDVDAAVKLAKRRHPDLPVFLLGHSAGGVVSCGYAVEHQDELAGLVCESFAHEVPAPPLALTILKGLSRVAPRLGVLKLDDERFSRDPEFVERMKHDPLIDRQGYPAHSVAELVRADEMLRNGGFRRIHIPVLILHGTADRVTRPHGSERFRALGGSSDLSLELYPGHYHDLLNDLGRERVLDDIVQWIEARIPATTA